MTAPSLRWRIGGRLLPACAAIALACGLQAPEKPAPTPSASPNVTTLPPAGYTLVWADEFDGTALNPGKWTAAVGPRRGYQMTPDAAQVQGGFLTITTYTGADGTQHSGFLTTEGHYQAVRGYFEARIKFSDSPGEWCAFWLYSPTNGIPLGDPADAGVEIDVVEHRVTDQGGWLALRDMVAMNLNWDGYGAAMKNAQKVTALPNGAPVQGTWHNYGVLWTAAGYTFYVDGMALWSSTQAISATGESVQLTCEVQGQSWAGNIPVAGYGSRDTSTTGMQVDYVHVWQAPQ
jgi:beta-glucanase (GH16 family)